MKSIILLITILAIQSAQISAFKLGFNLKYPLHASCKASWSWPNTDCSVPMSKLVDQINTWTSADNCKNGGEKCLYTLVSKNTVTIKATHKTPVKFYVDDLTFTVTSNSGTCQMTGFSTSETWYAVLDYGTNYCNMHNLITGAGLDKVPGYTETTSDDQCTQFSTADCEKY